MGTLINKTTIKIGGKEYEDYNFMDIVLTHQLLSPGELRFTMRKNELINTIQDSSFPIPKELIGKEVECKIETIRFDEDDNQVKELLEFHGVVFKVQINRTSDMYSEQLINVQAYSHDYLLVDHPHCFSYEDMTLKNIVAKTLEPYEIPNEINPRITDIIPYTVQYNESNYQFLIRLAQRYGEWMYHDGQKWIFGKIKKKETIKLEPRNDIIDYRFKVDLIHHKVKHAHHDYMKYENLVKSNTDFTDLTNSGYHELTDAAKDKSDSLFTKNTFQHLRCSNPEVNDIDELEVSVKAQLFGEKTRQVVCTGSTVRSDLTIGSIITICDHFYGESSSQHIDHDELIITSISHSTETNGHYINYFTAYPAKSEYPPYYNDDVYPLSAAQRAKVMDNKDPEKLGRIRVQFLWQEEQDPTLMTPWIRIAQPHGGKDKGFYFIPEIDEEVIVDFENANAEKPYVTGTLYHGKQRPFEVFYTDRNDFKIIRTRRHELGFCDKDDDGHIWINDLDGNFQIFCHSEDQFIKLFSRGNIFLEAEKDIIMKAGGNRISTIGGVDDVSSGSHNYKAEGAIHIDGKTFFAQGADKAVINSSSLTQIQSDSTANILGNGSVLLGSGGALEVSAGASLDLSADGSIDIKASAPMTLDAPIININ